MPQGRRAPSETPLTLPTQAQKEQAAHWFEELRDRLCAALAEIELEYAETRGGKAASFERKSWERPTPENEKSARAAEPSAPAKAGGMAQSYKDGGGGVMSILRGQVFEKAGVNVSAVYGHFSKEFRAQIPGATGAVAVAGSEQGERTAEQSRQNYAPGAFWASGLSMIVHPRNPKVPAVHMNTRHIVTSHGWFGGAADLNPVFPNEEDTAAFHARLKAACEAHGADFEAYKQWCDEYFYIPHRQRPRGAGGIFYDDLSSGDWGRDFAFTRAVGEAVLEVYPQIARRHMFAEYSAEEREQQLIWRGHYAEFNLVYDRGTKFGLATGGNPEAVLMSLPPEAKWP